MRAKAVNMNNRIINFDGNMLVRKAFPELEFDVQVNGKGLIRVNICDWIQTRANGVTSVQA
jgi:hypothetical protein